MPEATAESVVTCLKTAGDKADEWQKANSRIFRHRLALREEEDAETKMAGTSPAMTQVL